MAAFAKSSIASRSGRRLRRSAQIAEEPRRLSGTERRRRAATFGSLAGLCLAGIAVTLMTTVGLPSLPKDDGQPVRIVGATSLGPLFQEFDSVEALPYRSAYRTVSGDTALRSLIESEADLAVIERGLKPSDIRSALDSGVAIRSFALLRGEVGIYAHPSRVPALKEIDQSRLNALFFGRRPIRWKELGIDDLRPVKILVCDPSLCAASRAFRDAISEVRPRPYGPLVRFRSGEESVSATLEREPDAVIIAADWEVSDPRLCAKLPVEVYVDASRRLIESHLIVRDDCGFKPREYLAAFFGEFLARRELLAEELAQ